MSENTTPRTAEQIFNTHNEAVIRCFDTLYPAEHFDELAGDRYQTIIALDSSNWTVTVSIYDAGASGEAW